jgi:hypothetical protein
MKPQFLTLKNKSTVFIEQNLFEVFIVFDFNTTFYLNSLSKKKSIITVSTLSSPHIGGERYFQQFFRFSSKKAGFDFLVF